MSERSELVGEPPAQFTAELTERLHGMVDALMGRGPDPTKDMDALIASAEELLNRKLSMTGTKSETRRHLEALLRERLRAVFEGLDKSAGCEPLAMEVLLGTMLSGSLLSDFADAVDRVIIRGGSPRDYSFAGRADFISLEDVLQLLGGSKHRGRLTLEKPDNRLDIYLDNGTVAFLDPHRFIRRVLPMSDRMTYREISTELLEEAEVKHTSEGLPIFMTLQEKGFFRKGELRDMMRVLGSEVLFEFLREQRECAYSYNRLDELPQFALEQNLRIPVTPILLEGNKRRDEWLSLSNVFPDPDKQLRAPEDLFARIGAMDLGVLEIKMLAQIGNGATPRQLVNEMGLPLQEVYHYLVRFAKSEVLLPPGGLETLDELAMTIEESVEMAWQALDENDDEIAVSSALDNVFGDDGMFGEDDGAETPTEGVARILRTVEDEDD